MIDELNGFDNIVWEVMNEPKYTNSGSNNSNFFSTVHIIRRSNS